MSEEVFEDRSPVFVLGAGRSGTTLLARMLDAHPDVAIADEIIYFDIISMAKEIVPRLDSLSDIDRFFSLLPSMDHVRYWSNVDGVLARVRERLVAEAPTSYSRFYLYFMEAWAERSGARRFGEKTPWNVRHLEELLTMFPRCRILHIVRDPRAVVASRRAMPRSSRDVVTNAVKWLLDVESARGFLRENPWSREHVLEVRYEDLVQDPEGVLRSICDFIGEPFDTGMLAFQRSTSVMFRDQPYRTGVFRPVFSDSIEAWRHELDDAQVGLIEIIAAPLMRHYGYAPASPRRAGVPALMAQALREFVAWRSFKREERALFREEGEIRFRHSAGRQYRLLARVLARRFGGSPEGRPSGDGDRALPPSASAERPGPAE